MSPFPLPARTPGHPRRRAAALTALLGAVALCQPALSAARAEPLPDPATVPITLVAINDFHGRLDSGWGTDGSPVAGAAYLATHVRQIREEHPDAILVDAGDLTGHTVGLAHRFGDEPVVEAMNLMGLDVHTAGNHEFDDGLAALRRLRDGGCWLDDCSYRGGTEFPGAAFTTLSSNIRDAATGELVFPAWTIREVNGVQVGFVGATDTATLTPRAREELDYSLWNEEVVSSAAEAEAAGADVVVLVRHQGINNPSTDIGSCPDDPGLRAGLAAWDDVVDVVIDAHTHAAYVCDFPDAPLLTQAAKYGAVYTEIHLRVDASTGEVVSREAANHLVTHDVVPDAGVTALIDQYERWLAQLTSPTTAPPPDGREPTIEGTVTVSRVAGGDRVATAAELARRFDQADTVLLARADHFADALVAGPLAAQEGAPLLLTHRDGLATAAAEQLTRLRPGRVVLVGGPGALGPAVEAQVAALPWLGADAVERIAGSDRYDTAARIAARIQPDDRREAFLTTGTNYPDALAGAALAAQWQAPVLLTDPAALPTPTGDALAALGLHDLVVLGGDAAVAPEVAAQAAEAAGVPARRIAGADRYATAAAVAEWFESFSTAMVATGRDFPDALAGVAAAADVDAPVLLVEPDTLPDATAAQIDRVDTSGQDGHVVVIGGTKAVSEDVMLRLVRGS